MVQTRVLVVDDDAIVLASCRRVLEAEGFELIVASCAARALEVLGDQDLDLLLVDVKMPGHDGVWLTREAGRQRPGIPIVVMSGYPTAQTMLDGFDAGAVGFLAKPFTPDELLGVVREALREE